MSCGVSVLIATYNRAGILRETLEAMTDLKPPAGGWELIVIDNNSTDHTKRVCEEFTKTLPIRYVLERKQGKNHALNTGLELACGNLLVFTDDDVTPDPRWLVEYEKAADKWVNHSIFGGPIICSWHINTPVPVKNRKIPWLSFGRHQQGQQEGPYPDEVLPNGANLAIRARIFAQGYKYDPAIGPRGQTRVSGSETELLLRLVRNGNPIIYLPKAVVTHRINEHEVTHGSLLTRSLGFGKGYAHLFRHEFVKCRSLHGVPIWLLNRLLREAAKCLFLLPFGLLWQVSRNADKFRLVHSLVFNLGSVYQLCRTWRSQLRVPFRRFRGNRPIIIFDDFPGLGGVATYVRLLAHEWAREGREVIICARRGPVKQYYEEKLRTAGVSVRDFDFGESKGIGGISLEVWRLCRRLRPRGVIVNSTPRPRAWCVPFAARMAEVPAIALVEHIAEENLLQKPTRSGRKLPGFGLWRWQKRLRKVAQYLPSSHVVAVSEGYKRLLSELYGYRQSRITVIHHGVPSTPTLRTERSKALAKQRLGVHQDIVIGSAGRFVVHKRFDLLLDAFARVKERTKGVAMAILGDGPMRYSLQDSACSLGIQREVCFPGWVDDMPTFYSAIDIFVLASEYEAFGFVLIEAMAAGLPVISTKCIGPMEIITPGSDGFLVKRDAESLADVIVYLVENSTRRLEMGRNAAETARSRFDIKQQVAAMNRILDRPSRLSDEMTVKGHL